MSRIIGIDLGTTNSCVAVTDARGTPVVLTAADRVRTTPSAVAFTAQNEVLVGAQAVRQAVTNPHHTIFGAKRLMGLKVNAKDVAWFAKSSPYRIVAAPNGDAWIRLGQGSKSPQEIASHILRKLRSIAEEALGEPVTRAVVTVPAYFNDHQRQATRDAGTIAGLDVVRILNEPTAAALAFGAHRVQTGRRVIAVFDLGGGTFDISIMAVEHGIFEVLATNGNMTLGGDDWDRRVIERIADEIFDQHRVDLTSTPVALGRLKEAAEAAKFTLAAEPEAVLRLPYLATTASGQPIHVDRVLSRDEFEQSTADLVDQLTAPCRAAIADSGLSRDEIAEVLLVGGMTRSPAVQAVVEPIFGRPPSRGANPDEVVALGAAAYGGILAGEQDDAALLDVTPHDIGIKVGDSKFTTLVARNSMLPVRARRLFATSHDDQRFVQIEVYQGEDPEVAKNRKLGQVVLTDLPPGAAGSVRVELTLTLDVESLLHISARELTTGKQAEVKLKPTGGLSRKEIVEIIQRRRAEESDDEAPGEGEAPDDDDGPGTGSDGEQV